MKYLKPVLLCIIIGFLMGLFLYSGYEKNSSLLPVLKEGSTLQFLKVGVYDSEADMEKNVSKIANYIYLVKDEKYTVYIGITSTSENFKKIQEYYQTLGYVTSKESFYVGDKKFLEALKTYDQMLSNTNDKSVIENIINGTLTKYEEFVTNG